MATVKGATGQETYPWIVDHVLTHGRHRKPRGLPTIDTGHTVIELETPFRALPLGCGRELNRNIAVAEAVQLIGGFTWVDLLTKASPNFNRFLEADGKFHGSYGARINHQVLNVIQKLTADPDTRQAVVTLWDPWLDNLVGRKDYPCTVMLQFEIDERGHLCMNTVMRSNDVFLGLPYDMFQFTQLQISVAHAMGLMCGTYRHTVMSLHMYTSDADAAAKIHAPTDFTDQPAGIGIFGQMPFTDIMKRARQVAGRIAPENETSSERWYRERFASYMG